MIICAKCDVRMVMHKIGEFVAECKGSKTIMNTFRYFSGDIWKCPECGVEVISGFGNPIYDGHYEVKHTIIS